MSVVQAAQAVAFVMAARADEDPGHCVIPPGPQQGSLGAEDD